MTSSYLMNLLASAVAVIVGIVIHESAHAATAWALGDKTARSRGRVSLNPLNHIDPFGTIILPSCTQRTATSTPACPLPWHHRS